MKQRPKLFWKNVVTSLKRHNTAFTLLIGVGLELNYSFPEVSLPQSVSIFVSDEFAFAFASAKGLFGIAFVSCHGWVGVRPCNPRYVKVLVYGGA